MLINALRVKSGEQRGLFHDILGQPEKLERFYCKVKTGSLHRGDTRERAELS